MGFFASQVWPVLKANEGGYVNNPNDPGGETNYGITAETARRYGYGGPMRDLPLTKAIDIYEQHYFIGPKLNSVATLAPALAVKLCDIAVNMGPHYAGEFLQIALNGLNRQGRDYADLKVDGDIGRKTVDALQAYCKARPGTGQMVLIVAVRSLQAARYITLTQTNPKLEDFLYGWLLRAQGV